MAVVSSTRDFLATLMQGHADPLKHRVASVLTGAQFAVFQENASRSPMFVLPIFKGPNAFESIVVQCQLPIVLITSLEEYKRCVVRLRRRRQASTWVGYSQLCRLSCVLLGIHAGEDRLRCPI